MSTEPKHPVDWEEAEKLYRAGQLSNVLIAKKVGITEGALRKRAKRDGWTKDLSGKVQAAVRAALVRDEGTSQVARVPDPRTEREIIEQAAASAVQVVREHRIMLVRAGTLSTRLFEQLDDATKNREDIVDAIHEEMDPQILTSTGAEKVVLVNRRNRMLAAVSLPGHAATFRDLSNAVKNFITVERQSWGLDDADKKGADDPFAGLSSEELSRREALITAELAALEKKPGGG